MMGKCRSFLGRYLLWRVAGDREQVMRSGESGPETYALQHDEALIALDLPDA